MRRITVSIFVILALSLLAVPLAAVAQPAGQMWRIGYLPWRSSAH